MSVNWLMAACGLGLGALLGCVHFGGLWWTLKAMPRASRPRRLFWLSLAGRMLLTLAGFRMAAEGGASCVLPAAAGLLIAREALKGRVAGAGG